MCVCVCVRNKWSYFVLCVGLSTFPLIFIILSDLPKSYIYIYIYIYIYSSYSERVKASQW